MPNMPELLKQIQRDLACPICGRKFELSGIKIRGMFEQVLIVQTTCSEGHLTIFMTFLQEQAKEDNTKVLPPLTIDEVLDLTNKLKKFNGDFEKIWVK